MFLKSHYSQEFNNALLGMDEMDSLRLMSIEKQFCVCYKQERHLLISSDLPFSSKEVSCGASLASIGYSYADGQKHTRQYTRLKQQ